ncbi:MAG TPA: hypothetical protein IAA61_06760 [Candidatus Ornithomonoglobus merdipullorum]|uniref:Uncharacterized protein n=1 Tax=Candidatus Ornithomonoglobus merdipullorum TaxID=2840895 RepID=A0A9D1MCC5_9FIRM|nr:hypothetical protein [Candidatus Ornithomonoglobus merdipullorum]
MQFDIYPGKGHGSDRYVSFGGLNRTRRAGAGEFSDMENMGTLEYPCAAPRGKRAEVFEAPYAIDAVTAPDSTNVAEPAGFTGICGGSFYYNGTKKSGNSTLTAGLPWEIIRMGNLYIMNGYDPASKTAQTFCYNIDNDSFGEGGDDKMCDSLIVMASNDSAGSYLSTFRYGFPDVYEYTAVSDDGSRQIANADFFDKYGDPVISPPNIFEQVFSVGEEVEIAGFPSADGNFGQVWRYQGSSETVIPQRQLDYAGNNTIDTDLLPTIDELGKWDITNAYVKGFELERVDIGGSTAYIHKIYLRLVNRYGEEIDFVDMADSTGNIYCSGVSVFRRRRTFDHIAAHNGRLWGSVPTGNRIYVSNSNDYFDFTSASVVEGYAGRIESDTPGTFTALAEYGSELVAFKEDSISVIYGSGAYGVSVIPGIGCIDGRSVALTPSGMIFLAAGGFYGFSGSQPAKLSEKLGRKRYISAVGGFDGEIYYVSAKDKDGASELLAYDTRYGTWHRQDGLDARGFFRHRAGFYIAAEKKVYETNAETGETVEWSFTGAPVFSEKLGLKAVCELWIRAELAEDAEFTVYTSVENGGYRRHSTFRGGGMRIVRCPVRAVMGGGYRYRISGSGEAVFYEIDLRVSDGGARYKDADVSRQLAERF